MFLKMVTAMFVVCSTFVIAKSVDPHILIMVRPTYFQFNTETARTNYFTSSSGTKDVKEKANREFDVAVEKLRINGLEVLVLESPENAPDAVFPNNWFSLHLEKVKDGQNLLLLYPMLTANRAIERENTSVLIEGIKSKGISISKVYDFSHNEQESLALEGTGSLIFDPASNLVFMARSKRSDETIAREVCDALGKKLVPFYSLDSAGKPIYHTNVMMSVGTEYAVLCGDSLPEGPEKRMVYQSLQKTKKIFIEISQDQVKKMCGNIIEAVSQSGKNYIIMSQTAYDNFTEEQLHSLSNIGTPLTLSIDTIECVGGGSARCMVAVTNHS